MSYEITGTLIKLGDPQVFASGFTKREFVVRTDEKYPQEIKLEAVKDGCVRLDAYSVGEPITVSFNLRGNEHNGKHYVSLQAWKFDKSNSAPRDPATGRPTHQNGAIPPSDAGDEEFDDVPF